MSVRVARCRCGQWTARCSGDPARISVCHCLDCKRRSGSAFAAQVRYPADRITMTGASSHWAYRGASGHEAVFHFCPSCGSPLWYRSEALPALVAVPIGAFADPDFPAPFYSVWEARKHQWVEIVGEGVEHFD